MTDEERRAHHAEYMRKWRARNREAIHAYNHYYYLQNRDRILNREKQYQKDNPDKVRANQRAYYWRQKGVHHAESQTSDGGRADT